MGEQMQLLGDRETGIEKAQLLGGCQGAGHDPSIAAGCQLIEAPADERSGRRRPFRHRREEGHVVIAAPGTGARPFGADGDQFPGHEVILAPLPFT